jgi:hypothetical protein
MFFPAYTGQITPAKNVINFEGNCFANTTMTLEFDESNPSNFKVMVIAEGKRATDCSDTYLIANTEVTHVETFRAERNYTLSF